MKMMTKHLLLIDDDGDEADFFSEAISEAHLPLKFTYASDYDNAVEKLQMLNVDFIFLDFNMPKKNGLECLKQIKKTFPQLPASIFMYSTTINDFYNEAKSAGAEGCFKKQNSVTELVRLLRNIFDKV